jgi:DNA repair protein RadD
VFHEINEPRPEINPPVTDALVSSVDTTSSGITLRPYQLDVADRVEQLLATAAHPLIVAPTASGKTVILAEIIKRGVARHLRVLIVAHRREIIDQTKAKFAAHGVHAGVIMAGADQDLRPQAPVQIASIATLYVRAIRSDRMQLPLADLVVIDEAHHAAASTYRKIIAAYPSAAVLGATATPCRGDGCGLGGIFTDIVEAPQVAPLVEQGFLVPSRVYAPAGSQPDLRGVATRHGDYVESQLADRMDRAKLVGDVITHWVKFAAGIRTVVFATGVRHSIHIVEEFVRAGIKAEHLDGSTPLKDREAILARLASGETAIVSNCMVLTEGWDMPAVGCCILARPTKKMGLFRQMIGRVLRPAEGKQHAIILDHSGAVYRHGLPEDHVEWTLDPEEKAFSPTHTARLERKAGGLLECTQCHALRVGGQPCGACGFMPKRPGEYVRHVEGDLALVQGRRAEPPVYDIATKRNVYGQFTRIAREMGKSPGWPFHLYVGKFNEKPPWSWRGMEAEPTPEARAYVRSRIIAFAKSRDPRNPRDTS